MANKGKSIWFKIVTNRYLLAVLIFLAYLFFFDKYSIPKQVQRTREAKKIERQKKNYRKQIQKDSLEIIKMNSDTNEIEKYGREEYLMKRENEDVYLIIEEEKE